MMTRTIDFRFPVFRDGSEYCLLQPAGNAPSVRMDDSADIKTAFTGSFMIPEKPVDWMTDVIRPEMILDGVTHRLGIFLPATVSESDNGILRTVQVEAYDRGWLARDCRAESPPYFAAGTGYLSAVESVLTACGIVQFIETPTEAVLAEDREDWDIGTSWLEIANQLLDEINYEHVWFDKDGSCVLEPVSTPSAASIEHTLDEHLIESMLVPGMKKTTDFYSTPNVFICICSNADKADGMVATAENTNPQSPLSIARRGRRIAQVFQVDNIASQEELQLYADRLVTDSMLTGETVSVQTALLPSFGVGDSVALQYGDVFSICRERAWSMQLGVGGKMTHTLEKVVYNLD